MSRWIFLGTLLLAFPMAAADDQVDPMARDLLILTDWFEGVFDNEEQVWFEADPRSATSEPDRLPRIHTTHRRVDLDPFGGHVFYVEEYKENDPEDVFRQRLVIFSSDVESRSIRMQQGFFKDTKALRGAHRDSRKIENLSTDQVTFLNECDVYWRRVADQFHGEMRPKACVFGEGEERRYSVHNLILSANKLWRVDSTFLVADDTLFRGHPIDRFLQLRRAKPFTCDVYFYGDKGQGQILKGLSMHSQGGMLNVTRESDGASFDVLMRDKEYPYYETRPDFIYFSIRRGGEQRSIAFSVNDPDSRQLGMRTEEVGAFCFREGYSFREAVALLPR